MATAGKAMDARPSLSASSIIVTVTVAAAPAAVGVPLMAPVVGWISSPAGSPMAAYESMSVSLVVGSVAASTDPTFSDVGGV